MNLKKNRNNSKIFRRVYLDYAAATPVDKRVLDAMQPYFSKHFENAGSVYKEGVVAKEALFTARTHIATGINAHSDEVIFTSSGTESNNLAIFGVIAALEEAGTKTKEMHVITSTIEHPSVLECFKVLEKRGVQVSYVGVNDSGLVDEKEIRRMITSHTVLISLMYINNEIGTIQPVLQLAKLLQKLKEIKKTAPFFHTDASQAPLYFNCSVDRLGVDLMSVDAQKLYGPKGVGFLYKKRRVPLRPLLVGGGQEFGLRPGTENIPAIVGFAKAFDIAVAEREKEYTRLTALRDYFINEMLEKIPGVELNGDRKKRVPNNVNISIPRIEAEFFVLKLDAEGIAASTRSACLSHEDPGSYVVAALGKGIERARSALRFSLGRETTKKDIDYVITTIIDKVQKI